MLINDLSVIVPTKNEVENIPAFLRSLPPRARLVVVDASQDHTRQLVDSLRPQHTTVLRHSGAVAGARQLGADVTSTPWLLFTDADIVFSASYFNRLALHEDCDVVYGPKLSADAFAGYYRWFGRGQRLFHTLGIPAASGSNLLVRRNAFVAAGGFDLQLSCNEDSELVWRIKRHGYRVVFAPDLVVYAQDHRRLEWGMWRKILHSFIRCTLLYFDLIPNQWRSHDWGYWSHPDSANPGEGVVSH